MEAHSSRNARIKHYIGAIARNTGNHNGNKKRNGVPEVDRSFQDQSHLNAIPTEAEGIVNNAVNTSKGRA